MDQYDKEVKRGLKGYEANVTEFDALVASLMPPEMLEHFQQQEDANPTRYIRLIGNDRVCTRCGAVVHSGAKRHHSLYHRQLTLAIWLLQGFALASRMKQEEMGVEEAEEL